MGKYIHTEIPSLTVFKVIVLINFVYKSLIKLRNMIMGIKFILL